MTESTPMLPAAFEELESFVADWALDTETARMHKRWSSDMNEIRQFYDVMVPYADAALDHLERFSIDALPESEERLFNLVLSLAEAASSVEVYEQPGVRYGFSCPDRLVRIERS